MPRGKSAEEQKNKWKQKNRDMPPSDSESDDEDGSDSNESDNESKGKGVEGLIDIENPNRVQRKRKLSTPNESDNVQLTGKKKCEEHRRIAQCNVNAMKTKETGLRMRAFEVVNHSRTKKFNIGATDFQNMINTVSFAFEINNDVTLVLESDGTKVDKDYFEGLDSNLTLMILEKNQIWIPEDETILEKNQIGIPKVETNSADLKVKELLKCIEKDPSSILKMNELDLELLSNINPDKSCSFNKKFFHDVKKTSSRFLSDKKKIKRMLHLFDLIKDYPNQTHGIKVNHEGSSRRFTSPEELAQKSAEEQKNKWKQKNRDMPPSNSESDDKDESDSSSN